MLFILLGLGLVGIFVVLYFIFRNDGPKGNW